MTLYIKNMVCDRCIMAVRQLMENHGLHPSRIQLGEVELVETTIEQNGLERLREALQGIGFELMDAPRRVLDRSHAIAEGGQCLRLGDTPSQPAGPDELMVQLRRLPDDRLGQFDDGIAWRRYVALRPTTTGRLRSRAFDRGRQLAGGTQPAMEGGSRARAPAAGGPDRPTCRRHCRFRVSTSGALCTR